MSTPTDLQVLLEAVRDALKAVPGVATAGVGLEANMTPADYPMARIVPQRIEDGTALGRESIEALIYFGSPIHEFSGGLEALYWDQLRMREALLAGLQAAEPQFFCKHHETILDEDRVDAYKIFAMRVTIEW